jgi:uncharacterized membrane protein YeaQ/YmgE (transglycosylase-associated protein family)
MAAGTLFFTVHILNGWLLKAIEISDHISLLYLPAFLRLMNVLVLGMLWGTLGTAVGGLLLFFWSNDSLLLSCLNMVMSAGGAALAVWWMRILQGRALSLARLSDLLQLSLLYALLNSFLHHLLWSFLDPAQLVSSNQIFFMILGDLNGAVLGAIGLRWMARNTQLVDMARAKANASRY